MVRWYGGTVVRSCANFCIFKGLHKKNNENRLAVSDFFRNFVGESITNLKPTTMKKLLTCIMATTWPMLAAAQMGARFPSERKVIADPQTGV